MRKNRKILKTLMVIFFTLITTIYAGNITSAYAASGSLTGPGTVRAGDTITLTLKLSAQGSYGIEGAFSYDSSLVTLSGINIAASGWKLESNGNNIVAYDDALTNPLGSSQNVLTATFKINGNVSTGTAINISIINLVATDGSNESNIGTVTYSVKVAAPLSGNANLSSLSVSGQTLSPAFNKDTTSYTLGEVDFSVSSLSVKAAAEDSKAGVTVQNTQLSVGSNTVTVVVTAENGNTKKYTITVTRKQDPNYVASSNANLKDLTPGNGKLSPKFSADITEYVVYLPYESSSFSATGTAADDRARGVTNVADSVLTQGANKFVITCTAEDGTTKDYNITVMVMPEYNGVLPNIEGVEAGTVPSVPDETESESEDVTEPSTEALNEKEVSVADTDSSESQGISILLAIIFIILSAVIGFTICYILTARNILFKTRQ